MSEVKSRHAFPIGTQTFPTKGAAVEAVREILNAAELDRPLIGDKGVFIREMFALHPNAAEKARRGVAGFAVRINDFHGSLSRGFHVLHDDGSSTPFSYQPCLNPKKPPLGATGAMRAAIMLGQRRVMMEWFGGKAVKSCPACDRSITPATAHVHHLPPNRFRDIVAAYVDRHGEPEISKAVLGVTFASAAVQHRWVEFHDARARRVVICAPCNYAAERET